MRRILQLAAAAALIAGVGSPALAQDYRHDDWHHDDWHHDDGRHDDWRRDDRGWHDHDIYRFRDYDFVRWRGGHWVQARRDGRVGWWWVVGPQWYFYPAPIYPYPDPYVPPAVAGAPAPGAVTYYYCDNPQGYYPYVQACPTPWRAVPAG
jgi:hypothetical protein